MILILRCFIGNVGSFSFFRIRFFQRNDKLDLRIMRKIKTIWLLSLLLLPGLAFSQIDEKKIIKAEGVISLNKVPVGSEFQIAVVVEITPPWHINANKPLEDMYIPTELAFEPIEGISFGEVRYPEPVIKTLSFSPEKMALYEEKVLLGIRANVDQDISLGSRVLRGVLSYQACNDEICLIPTEKEIIITIQVVDLTESINLTHTEVFTALGFGGSSPSGEGRLEGGAISNLLRERGLLITFFFVFLGGLALNLTPCVYPLIPITISYFGGQSGGSTSKTFSLALIYVLGMAVTYSILGLIAASTGSLFGNALQNPPVLIFVAVVLVTLSLSMFGLYTIRLPSFLTQLSRSGQQGYVGAFFMGLTVGFVAAPCVGPFVLGLLTFVGELGNPILGFSLFFTLAMGLGLPFLVLGTLSGSIRKLPRSGAWLEWVERIFGFVLLGMAVFFLEPLIPDKFYWFIMSLLAISGGIFLGWMQKAEIRTKVFQFIRKGTGLAGLALGAWILFAPGHVFVAGSAEKGIHWNPYDESLIQQAKAEGKPAIIDFSADWCLPCKELDILTFSVPEVVEKAEGFVTIKADLTRGNSPEAKNLRGVYEENGWSAG
jgi:thiol:disulfide interchange protein DsbD